MSLFRRLRRRLRRLSRRSSRPAFTGFQSLEGRVLLSAVTASSAAAFVGASEPSAIRLPERFFDE